MAQSGTDHYRAGLRSAIASVVVGTAILCAKFIAYELTGSAAILSDALESIINVVAGGFALGSFVLAAKPPDDSHPYGHGKIEYFSAGFEGALILVAAVGIFVEGLHQVLSPKALPQLGAGLIIVTCATGANLVLGLVLIRTGKRIRSLTLEADGRHVLTDVLSSGAMLLGLAAVSITGAYRLDGIVACVIGCNIVVSGFKLVRQAFGGLMDASDPVLLEEICGLLARNRKELWIDVHRLRAWRAGRRVHADFHLILPRELPLEVAHAQVKELERVFSDHFDAQSEILVHLDSCVEPDCTVCANDPCDLRSDEQVGQRLWKRENLTCEAEVALLQGQSK